MKQNSYFRVVVFALALAMAISLWFASLAVLCYAQGGYGGAGGGGGGGGGVIPPGVTYLGDSINPDGMITQDVTASSFDGQGQLALTKGTMALKVLGTPLYMIIMFRMEDPPPPPEGFKIIGVVYNFAPDGATFEPALTFTFTYNPAFLPEGICQECLVLAMWDEATGKWVILDSVVDPNTNTITAQVSHFTAFTTLAKTTPATFTVTDLAIAPNGAGIGEKVTISALVTNTGCLSGDYEVTLKIDDVVEATEKVTLPGRASQKVTFTVTRDVARTYTADVNGLTRKFEVEKVPPPPPAPAPPAPTPSVPPPPAPPPASLINWWFIGIIIAGCTIIGVAIWLVTSHRRA